MRFFSFALIYYNSETHFWCDTCTCTCNTTDVPMVLRWGHFELRTYANRAKMRESEVAKAKVRRRTSETAKMRWRSAKMRRFKCKTKEWYYYISLLRLLNFAFSPSQLRTLALDFYCVWRFISFTDDFSYIIFYMVSAEEDELFRKYLWQLTI